MRNLVSIKQVDEVRDISGADNIQEAILGGWHTVVKKGEFRSGDYGVFYEIDSWLPESNPNYQFLMKPQGQNKVFQAIEGYRLRTMKLRGVLSQGLLLPLDSLLNTDLSESLGILKWEKYLNYGGSGSCKPKGNFPNFIPKTDQERVQNLTRNLELYRVQDEYWEVTEKLDGSSCTVYFNDGNFGVCSRNIDLEETEDNMFWQAAIKYDLRTKLETLGNNFAIQGELISHNIQGNPYRYQEDEFYFHVFDIFDIDKQEYLTSQERIAICNSLHLDHVPVVNYIKITQSVDEILKMAEGKSIINPKVEREGLVFKNTNNGRLSFKAISNKWLLKED